MQTLLVILYTKLLKKVLHDFLHISIYFKSRTHLLQGARVRLSFSKGEPLLGQCAVQSSHTAACVITNEVPIIKVPLQVVKPP